MTGTLFEVAYGVFGLIAGVASIYSAWFIGSQPAWVRVVAVLALLLIAVLAGVGLRFLRPVLRKTLRGHPMVQDVRTSGLRGVETRNEGDRHLAPQAIYEQPTTREVVITGISAASTFNSHLEKIKVLLRNKVDVYVIACGFQKLWRSFSRYSGGIFSWLSRTVKLEMTGPV